MTEPCQIDGLWVVAKSQDPREPNIEGTKACAAVPGGCFPPGEAIWGDVARGPLVSWQVYGTYGDGRAREPRDHEITDMKRALKTKTVCDVVESDLLSRIESGGVKLAMLDGAPGSKEGTYGFYNPDDATIYIFAEAHWSGVTANLGELVQTLVHEGIHAWFGAGATHDTDFTVNRDRAISECFASDSVQ